jgi:hypothetical protein
MRELRLLGTLALLCLPACGGADDAKSPSTSAKKSPGEGTVGLPTAFDPGPVVDGYTRYSMKKVEAIGPGDDVTYCQYVTAPFDHDVDIVDVTGAQSKLGHHAIAFAYTGDGTQEVGTVVPCMGTEFSMGEGDQANASLSIGGFLGGAGSNGKSGVKLPEGVAFRLKKGEGIMLNAHYLNTTVETYDGDSVVDVKFADVDPNRNIAAMFVNVNLGFTLAPAARSTSHVDCVAGADFNMLMMTNHMHDFGSSATSEVLRVEGSATEMMHEDPTWTYEMQFNANYSTWSVAKPFVIHKGDTVRTTCNWNNERAEAVTFPREMCVGVGFVLAKGDNPHAPACINGQWLDTYF